MIDGVFIYFFFVKYILEIIIILQFSKLVDLYIMIYEFLFNTLLNSRLIKYVNFFVIVPF